MNTNLRNRVPNSTTPKPDKYEYRQLSGCRLSDVVLRRMQPFYRNDNLQTWPPMWDCSWWPPHRLNSTWVHATYKFSVHHWSTLWYSYLYLYSLRCNHNCIPLASRDYSAWEVQQNQVSSRSFYIQLIPGEGTRPDLPGMILRRTACPDPTGLSVWQHSCVRYASTGRQ